MAEEYVQLMNSLHTGKVQGQTRCRREGLPEMQAAWSRVHVVAVREATRLVRGRRGLGLTGVQAVSELVKSSFVGAYSRELSTRSSHEVLAANAVDEPTDTVIVDMLSALPEEDAAFYADEANVIDYEGKSDALFKELEDRYGFVGGSEAEYAAYFRRPDLPDNLWHFALQEEVRAVAGFSVVGKKQAGHQRKVLMQVAANYIWKDVGRRAELGMAGGETFTHLHVPTDRLALAAFDQSNAFTSVRTPRWCWGWCAAPPLRAALLWDQLPRLLRRRHKNP